MGFHKVSAFLFGLVRGIMACRFSSQLGIWQNCVSAGPELFHSKVCEGISFDHANKNNHHDGAFICRTHRTTGARNENGSVHHKNGLHSFEGFFCERLRDRAL